MSQTRDPSRNRSRMACSTVFTAAVADVLAVGAEAPLLLLLLLVDLAEDVFLFLEDAVAFGVRICGCAVRGAHGP